MGQVNPIKPTALVVEDDVMQREMLTLLLEESDMSVIQCESAEAGETVLDEMGNQLSLMLTDVNLAGMMSGIQLAHIAKQRLPDLPIIVMSGAMHNAKLPDGTTFLPKPWLALDILRAAERAQSQVKQG